jgi:hypothetical protein
MKLRHIFIGALLILLAICACDVLFAYIAVQRRRADEVLYDSAVHTLQTDTHTALSRHYERHGEYPTDLKDLEYTAHHDEFHPSMLKDLVYSPSQTNYSLQIGQQRLGLDDYRWSKED